MTTSSTVFQDRASDALANTEQRHTIRAAAELLDSRRQEAASGVEDFEGLRDAARAAKFNVLRNLEARLLQFESRISENGGHVHFAADADEANQIILDILKRRGVTKVVKSKSMATEEIELNPILEKHGIKPVETDLGEFVAQLKGDKPSHIILPIIHLSRQRVADVFNQTITSGATDDVAQLVETARLVMRKEFETAGAGITGVNFGVADSGALCIVSNEGNARFVTTLPKTHIAVMGIEKLVTDFGELGVFLKLLARSATGQRLTVYSNLIWPGRKAGDGAGPEEAHVILLDNGRSDLLNSQASEILACIRCGACLNICPIYRAVGGHAYGGTYPGPMGSILSPALGHKQGSDLAGASTLCGACRDVCPVKIDIPRMLQYYRTGERFGRRRGLIKGAAFFLFGSVASRPRLYRVALSLARAVASDRWIRLASWIPFGWTKHRLIKLPARHSFVEQWHARKEAKG